MRGNQANEANGGCRGTSSRSRTRRTRRRAASRRTRFTTGFAPRASGERRGLSQAGGAALCAATGAQCHRGGARRVARSTALRGFRRVVLDIAEALVVGGRAFQRTALQTRLPLNERFHFFGEREVLVG